jgi:hypothetical protein
MRTLLLIIKEAILYGQMKLSTGSYILTLQRYMSSASDIFSSITLVMFPNYEDVD